MADELEHLGILRKKIANRHDLIEIYQQRLKQDIDLVLKETNWEIKENKIVKAEFEKIKMQSQSTQVALNSIKRFHILGYIFSSLVLLAFYFLTNDTRTNEELAIYFFKSGWCLVALIPIYLYIRPKSLKKKIVNLRLEIKKIPRVQASNKKPIPPSSKGNSSMSFGSQGEKRMPTAKHSNDSGKQYDFFLSHASEDKDDIARPLYEELCMNGFTVWFDEAELTLGDSLRGKIDEGLTQCSYGIVILSHNFFAKNWTQLELDALVSIETIKGEKAILPIWHNLDQNDITKYSPILAGKLGAPSTAGIPNIVGKIKAAVKNTNHP